jgi:cysteine desulfurase
MTNRGLKNQKTLIYLDHSATTPVAPEVIDAMLPYFLEHFGNASSIHSYGQNAKVALEDCRRILSGYINVF